MMEVNWGTPLFLADHAGQTVTQVGTIEKAHHLLRRVLPISEMARREALRKVEGAMECMNSVQTARAAFLSAAELAGYRPVSTI